MAEPGDELNASRALESWFDRAPDALVLLAPDRRIVRKNARAREVFDDDAAIAGAVEHAGDAFERAANLERGAIDVEVSAHIPPEAERTLELTLFPVRDGDRAVGVALCARDVTAQRTAELRLLESQQTFRSLYEHEPDAVIHVEENGMICTFNAATSATLGYDLEEMVGKPAAELFAPENRSAAAESIERVLGGAPTSTEAFLLAKDGRRVPVAVHVIPIVIEGTFEGAHIIATDLTALKRAERSAVEQSQRLRSLYLVAASGKSGEAQLYETLMLGLRLLGFDYGYVGEIEGDEVTIRFSTDTKRLPVGWRTPTAGLFLQRAMSNERIVAIPNVDDTPWASIAERERAPERAWQSLVGAALMVHGKPYGVVGFSSYSPRVSIPDTDKDLVGMIGALCATAIERIDHEQRLGSLAFFDSLTGLPNRVLLADRLNQTLIGSRRRKRQFALMYLDIDHFKRVNDEYGHLAGDQVLQVVAKRLGKALRESDTVARMSGDEFVIVQPAIRAPSDAFELARRVITELEAPIYLGSGTIEISASIGVAFFPEDATEAEDLIRRADSALYRAKAEGRGRASAYVPA